MKIREKLLNTRFGRMATDRFGFESLTAVATGIIMVVVLGMIGIYIAQKIYTIAGVTSGSQFATASGQVIDIMNSGFSLVLIAIIALIAGLVIRYLLTGFGGAGGGGAAGGY